MHKVDHLDTEIINLLMEDGRMSCSEIARRIGSISERSVRYRIERLIANGVIQVTAILNPKAVGYSVTADVFIDVEPAHILEVADHLAEYECVSYVACATGERDISLQVIARDNTEVYAFVTRVIAKIPGVRKTTTSIVPIIIKDVYQWQLPRDKCVDEEGTIAKAMEQNLE